MTRLRWMVLIGYVVILSAPAVCSADHIASALHLGLLHTLRTDRAIYALQEPVPISYSVTNLAPIPLPLQFPQCPCPVFTSVQSSTGATIWCDPCFCLEIYCEGFLLPGDSLSIQTTWDMATGTEPGGYVLRGTLHVLGVQYFFIDLPIEVVGVSTVPENPVIGKRPGDDESTWGRIKALFLERGQN